MSTYSHEHHVRVPQHAVLELMETFFRAQGYLSFDVASLPLEEEACEAFISADITATYQAYHDGFFTCSFVVSPTDAHGWTILWGNTYSFYHEELLALLSKQLQTTALYGHYYDVGGNWGWILFQQGKEVASYWYFGDENQRWGEYCGSPVLRCPAPRRFWHLSSPRRFSTALSHA